MRRLSFPLVALCAFACAHAKPPETPVTELRPPAPAPAAHQLVAQAVPEPASADAPETPDARALRAALLGLHATAVLFATDDATLTPEGEQKLAAVGTILARNPKLQLRIEGNCDERGTEGYNLALGQARAAEARRYLLRMGAADEQVATVSYGSERPKVPGHDESAWSQNRRDDIVVTGAANDAPAAGPGTKPAAR